MRGMKFRFSLSTLLICLTVLAVVCIACAKIDVVERGYPPNSLRGRFRVSNKTTATFVRKPTTAEAAWRMAWSGPVAVSATVASLWLIRRIRARRIYGQIQELIHRTE
jgi:hypothetical protein